MENNTFANTFELIFKCRIERFDDVSPLTYETPYIQDGAIVISPTSVNAIFHDAEIVEEPIALDTVDDNIRTFNISFTISAEIVNDTEVSVVALPNEIGELVIRFTDSQNRIIAYTENDLNPIVTEDIEDTDGPYSKKEIEDDLRSLTQNWTTEDTLKTGYEEEHQYALEILSQHYTTVEDLGRRGEWLLVRFTQPLVKVESYSPEIDLADVLNRFTRGELTIDRLTTIPSGAIPVPELGLINDTAEFYYDPASDVMGYVDASSLKEELELSFTKEDANMLVDFMKSPQPRNQAINKLAAIFTERSCKDMLRSCDNDEDVRDCVVKYLSEFINDSIDPDAKRIIQHEILDKEMLDGK